MEEAAIGSPEEQIATVVRTIAASYGGRREAHRLVMAHSLSRGGHRLAPLLSRLMDHLGSERQVGPVRHALSRPDVFVVAHAFVGVLRAMTTRAGKAPAQEEIEQALAPLVVRFIS